MISRKLATMNEVIVTSYRLTKLELYLLLLKLVTKKMKETERRIMLP